MGLYFSFQVLINQELKKTCKIFIKIVLIIIVIFIRSKQADWLYSLNNRINKENYSINFLQWNLISISATINKTAN